MLLSKKTQQVSVPGVLTPEMKKQQKCDSMVHLSYGNLKEHEKYNKQMCRYQQITQNSYLLQQGTT